MRRDYVLTIASEFLVLATGFAVLRVAASYWGPVQFGEYLLVRRSVALLYVPAFLGLGVSIPRSIALELAAASARPAAAAQCVLAGTILAGIPLALLGALVTLSPGSVASLLFGASHYRSLLPPLFLCVLGLLLHSLAYAHFRGHLRMLPANGLQVVNQGLVPLVVFFVPGLSVQAVIASMGLSWIATSGFAIARPLLAGVRATKGSVGEVSARARQLARYGLPRLPGDFALTVLFSLPATLTAHVAGVEEAGYVAFGLVVVSMMGSFFAPIGQVLLPQATAMIARGEAAELRRAVARLGAIGGSLAATGVVLLELVARPLVVWYLGPSFEPATFPLRIIVLGAVPYVLYVLLRSPIDAATAKAVNARNLLIALSVFGVGAVVMPTVTGVSLALVLGLTVCSVLTVASARALLRPVR